MNKIFTNTAWQEYLYWQNENRQILKRINELIKDIERNGNTGIGKPEPLRHELSGFWSSRDTGGRFSCVIKPSEQCGKVSPLSWIFVASLIRDFLNYSIFYFLYPGPLTVIALSICL